MLSGVTLFSNSKGNCILVTSDTTKVLVDAGVACCHIKTAMEKLGENIEEVSAILITHEHIDHIRSAGSLSRKYDIPVYATPKVWKTYRGFGNIKEKNKAEYDYGMTIGDLTFDFFKTYHDAVQPVGIVVSCGDKKLGICTDTGIFTPQMEAMLYGANALIFEANHDVEMLLDGSYPPKTKERILGRLGHLSNEDAAEALTRIVTDETQYITLAHLSEENNTPNLAYETVLARLEAAGIAASLELQVAPPCHTSKPMVIE